MSSVFIISPYIFLGQWEYMTIWTLSGLIPKGTFLAKISTINSRNGMDITEPEHIKMRWQEYIKQKY